MNSTSAIAHTTLRSLTIKESHIQIEANYIQHEFTIIKSGAVFINNEITGNITLINKIDFLKSKRKTKAPTITHAITSHQQKEGDQIKQRRPIVIHENGKHHFS